MSSSPQPTASSTSIKHKEFIKEPMGAKAVTDLPGIGKVLGARLEKEGYGTAAKVYGEYLVKDKDPEKFQKWAMQTCGANPKQGGDCFKGLDEWSNSYL